MIDCDPSWKNHHFMEHICHKVSKSVGVIAKLRQHTVSHVIYNLAQLTPYLSYGICCDQLFEVDCSGRYNKKGNN